MSNNNSSGLKKTALVFGMLAMSLVVGVIVGLATIDWWKELMFNGAYGAPVLMIIVLPVAFFVPFICSFLIQLGLWRFWPK